MGWKEHAAAVYADVKQNGEIDMVSQQMNKTFREIISDKFNEENKSTFSVAWTKDGIVL